MSTKSRSATPEKQATPPPAEASSSAEKPSPADASNANAELNDGGSKGADSESSNAATAAASSTAWQAIYSPQHNAYYFYNTETQETTWTNPLQAGAEASGSGSAPQQQQDAAAAAAASSIDPRYAAMQNAAMAQGIDPALAYLDPSFAGSASTSAGLPAGSFQARFNARTGQFTAMDGRTPDHMSEYERAKRMSTVFFDVEAWEKSVAADKAAEDEAGGRKRKRPSKKDLERFKEQKRLKKIAKTAWLRT
uniref:WW domain-containing protein n=1 Tax=Mycena chlorophos TaxID=658473 RepID=A0ABQ0KZT7_MYCCL|nr:predicted protein [Mycena chlorophos]